MADNTVPQQQYAGPAAPPYSEKVKAQYIQQTPAWVVIVRALQVLFGFIVLCMAGWLIHGYAMGANAFAVVCGLFTAIVVGYTLITEKVHGANGAYNIWAVLSLDFVMAIFWLASLGSNAALRAAFTQDVNIESCYNDGSAVSSNHCTISRRSINKRGAVAGSVGLSVMSAIAGVSALVWLLFIATLVFHGHTFRLWHQANKTPSADNATVEMKAQGTPMLGPQTAGAPAHPQYAEQQQYPSQYPPQAQPAAYPQQTAAYPQHPEQQQQQQQQQHAVYPPQQPSPAPYQQPGAQQYAQYPDPSQSQYSQQTYSPHGTPAPGQPYYPPAQQ